MGVFPLYKPKALPPGVYDGQPFPWDKVNPWSKLFVSFLHPFFKIAHGRPIDENDPWVMQADARSKYVADKLTDALQARIPPSRRTEGYRPALFAQSLTPVGSRPADRAIIFTPRASSEDSRDDPKMETLAVAAEDENNMADPLDPELRISRGHSRLRSTETRRPSSAQNGDDGQGVLNGLSVDVIAEKLAAAGSEDHSKEALIKRFGKRRTAKILEGKLAVEEGKLYDMSLLKACYKTYAFTIWKGSLMVSAGFAIRMIIPLVTRAIIDDIVASHAHANGDTSASPRPLGGTIGLTICFLFMMATCNALAIHANTIAGILGSKTRAALIDMISRKSLRLTTKARQKFTDGKINAFITSDAGAAESAYADLFLLAMCGPVIIIGCALIIYSIGVAGLAGIAVLAMTAPLQNLVFTVLIKYHKNYLEAVDKRTQLLTETVRHLHSIKLYAYEPLFYNRLASLRDVETGWVKKLTVINSAANVIGIAMPPAAAVVTLSIHVAIGKELNLGQIFSTLQYFNFIQQPMVWLPRVLSMFASTIISARRLQEFFVAEEKSLDHDIDPQGKFAINVNADFCHEINAGDEEKKATMRKRDRVKAKLAGLMKRDKTDAEKNEEETDEKQAVEAKDPFRLADVRLQIPRGSLVCIVGRVGSGKSTLMTGLIGETRRNIASTLRFSGRIAYVPQMAWVQSGPIRQNITFSSSPDDTDEARLASVIYACGLQEYLANLEDGVDTNVGERGITLSGGQKQRVNLARAAYMDSEIVLLDDPLSAVDAQVGHHLLRKCILSGPLADRTRVLVTHHLDVLPQADVILMLQSDGNVGRIVQQGSYADLIAEDGPFRTLIEEYGLKFAMTEKEDAQEAMVDPARSDAAPAARKQGATLTLDEDSEQGAVSLATYRFWLSSMGSVWLLMLLMVGYIASAGSGVSLTVWLGFWQSTQFNNLSSAAYQGIYAALAVASALITFACNLGAIFLNLRASIKCCMMGVERILRSPTSFLDRTPIVRRERVAANNWKRSVVLMCKTGRIVSRLTKDVGAFDINLAFSANRILTSLFAVLGSIGLVAWHLPWMCFGFLPVAFIIAVAGWFTQPANRDVKRIESLQRSKVYGNFAEQLNGLAVIRAFDKTEFFEKQLQASMDHQNRFSFLRKYMMTYLNMRMNSSIFLLPFGVALYGVINRNSVDPVSFAVTLTFILQTAYMILDIVPMIAMFEQEMVRPPKNQLNQNSVERLKHYSELESEAATTVPSDPPVSHWPSRGAITFKDVQLRYRPELPLVLKGLNFDVKAGEKVGIIGRTGAGKSSLVQSIYRTVELAGGSIMVDGVDLRGLGLRTMRSRLAIIPQESFLYAGSIRENIDPEGIKPDAELNDALSLIYSSLAASQSIREKFKLDTEVQADGSNFSAGEKQLLSLIRALLRGCKVLVLDEATSSVDPETDALIQRIIQTEFAHVTLLSIAHRLQTVAFYDRILVMDAGTVAEYDTPLRLFDTPGSIFRGLCDVKKISREDLLAIQSDAANAATRVT